MLEVVDAGHTDTLAVIPEAVDAGHADALATMPMIADMAVTTGYTQQQQTLTQPKVPKAPKVSVIMPSYNAEKTIEESIRSVIAQTFLDWELIVVDDGSRDSTVPIVIKLAESDSRISLYISPTNQGVAVVRNYAIEKASGQWIAFLDSDDIWHEQKLERQLRFAAETGGTITYTATSYMNATGKKFNYVLPAARQLTYKALLRGNIMSCSSVMVRRDVMLSFSRRSMTHEDYVMWLQLVKDAGQAYGLDEPLLVYRMAEGTKSSNRLTSAIMTFNAYGQAGYGVVASMFMTIRYAIHSISKRSRIKRGR